TGYDPQGRGRHGSGTLTGYTPEEVAAIPPLPAADLLAYLDEVHAALRAQLPDLTSAALAAPAPGGDGRVSAYAWIKGVLLGGFAHLGEIRALKALRERTRPAAESPRDSPGPP
ncbi:MAG TPA: DinB family protein, partial [Chloroflexia bacterium]|nr:DinB family protein [Chloroflexia bacterium]